MKYEKRTAGHLMIGADSKDFADGWNAAIERMEQLLQARLVEAGPQASKALAFVYSAVKDWRMTPTE